jgi:hypothetical protein
LNISGGMWTSQKPRQLNQKISDIEEVRPFMALRILFPG